MKCSRRGGNRVGACCSATPPSTTAARLRARDMGISRLGAGVMWGPMCIPIAKLHPRHEPAVVRHPSTPSVNSAPPSPGIDLPRRMSNMLLELARRGRPVLALFSAALLVAGRHLPTVRGEVHRHRPRHPALEYQSALGLGLGRLVFGELANLGVAARMLVIGGSLVMIAGAGLDQFRRSAPSEMDEWNAPCRASHPLRDGSRVGDAGGGRRGCAYRFRPQAPLVGSVGGAWRAIGVFVGWVWMPNHRRIAAKGPGSSRSRPSPWSYSCSATRFTGYRSVESLHSVISACANRSAGQGNKRLRSSRATACPGRQSIPGSGRLEVRFEDIAERRYRSRRACAVAADRTSRPPNIISGA